jgi:hypothetical protein
LQCHRGKELRKRMKVEEVGEGEGMEQEMLKLMV